MNTKQLLILCTLGASIYSANGMRTKLFRNGAKNIKNFAQTTRAFFNESEIKETKQSLESAKLQRLFGTIGTTFNSLSILLGSGCAILSAGMGYQFLKEGYDHKNKKVTCAYTSGFALTSYLGYKLAQAGVKEFPTDLKDMQVGWKKTFNLKQQVYKYRLNKFVKLFKK